MLMGLLVRGQIRRLGEPLEAIRVATDIWFLTSVRPQVRSKVEIQAEALVADFALVGLFTRVHELVPLELGVVKELLLAAFDRADEHSLAVGHLMLAKGALVGELLEAVLDVALVDARACLHPVERILIVALVRGVQVRIVLIIERVEQLLLARSSRFDLHVLILGVRDDNGRSFLHDIRIANAA